MQTNNQNLLNDKVGKLLFRLSMPAIIVLLMHALYNLVDAMFVGNQADGVLGIGGLTIVFPIQMLILAMAQTIGMGASSIISRKMGAGAYEEANNVTANAFKSVVILGILVTSLGLLFIKPLLLIFGATETISPYAYKYLRIILMGSIFYTFTGTANCIVRGEGRAIVSMICMVSANMLNMILDYVFVVRLAMGVEGAAIATIISQIVAGVFLLAYFALGKSNLKIKLKSLRIDVSLLKEITAIGFPTLVAQATGAVLSVVAVNSLKYYGTDMHITLLGIYTRTFAFIFMPILGITQGLQPIAGFNFGANHLDRVREVLKTAIQVATIICIVGFAVFMGFTEQAVSLFTNDIVVINEAVHVLRIAMLMLPVMGVQLVGASFFQAVGKAMPAAILSMARTLLFMIPFMLILPLFFGLQGVWYAVPTADLLAAVLTLTLLLRELHNSSSVKQKGFAVGQ